MEQTDDNAIDLGVNESDEELNLDLELNETQGQKPEETAEYWKNKYFKKQRLDKKEPQRPLQTKKNEELDSIKQDLSELKQERLKRQFGYENGLSPEEVDVIFRFNPNPTKEVLEDDFIKGGLDKIRAKKRVEANTPGSSTASGRITPPKPLTEMTADEKQKFHEEKMKAMYGDK